MADISSLLKKLNNIAEAGPPTVDYSVKLPYGAGGGGGFSGGLGSGYSSGVSGLAAAVPPLKKPAPASTIPSDITSSLSSSINPARSSVSANAPTSPIRTNKPGPINRDIDIPFDDITTPSSVTRVNKPNVGPVRTGETELDAIKRYVQSGGKIEPRSLGTRDVQAPVSSVSTDQTPSSIRAEKQARAISRVQQELDQPQPNVWKSARRPNPMNTPPTLTDLITPGTARSATSNKGAQVPYTLPTATPFTGIGRPLPAKKQPMEEKFSNFRRDKDNTKQSKSKIIGSIEESIEHRAAMLMAKYKNFKSGN